MGESAFSEAASMRGKMARLLLVVATVMFIAAGPAYAAGMETRRDMEDQVDLLMSEYPFGGSELSIRIGRIVGASKEPASTAVEMVLEFGASGARDAQYIAIANAMDGMPAVRPADLQAAVARAITERGEAMASARVFLDLAYYLGSQNQIAVGCGLASAVAAGSIDNSLGTAMRAAILSWDSGVTGVAYDACMGAAISRDRDLEKLAANGTGGQDGGWSR